MKNVRILIAVALMLPIALGAQQPTSTPRSSRANPVTESFKGFGYLGNWLMAAFDSIPADRYDYRPTPAQQSIGYVAQHLEDANYALCARFGGVARPMTAKDSLADTVKAKWPKDTLVARLRTSLLFCRDAIERVNDANLGDEYPVGPAGSGRTSVRSRDLILFVTDLADHYSQISNYMRLLGMIPPSALPRHHR